MFNHYHYWPERQAYVGQEEALTQGRIRRLIRQSQTYEPSRLTRLAEAIDNIKNRIVTRLRRVRTQLFERRAVVTAQRSSTWPLE